MRAVFSNKDFRIGLSYAINREELNQLIYAGQAKPYQAAPREGTALYDEKMATQYLEYNVDLANQYLDKVALPNMTPKAIASARTASGLPLRSTP